MKLVTLTTEIGERARSRQIRVPDWMKSETVFRTEMCWFLEGTKITVSDGKGDTYAGIVKHWRSES